MLSFVVGAGIALFVLWAVSLQRRLVVLDENIHQAMNQIGKEMNSSLKETAEGGLAATPTGCRLCQEIFGRP